MVEPTKQETEQAFKVLKSQKANKVMYYVYKFMDFSKLTGIGSHVSTATLAIQHGQALLSVFTSAWIARVYTGIWACILVLCGMRIF